MIIKVLGPGCANCLNLERATRDAVAALGCALRGIGRIARPHRPSAR